MISDVVVAGTEEERMGPEALMDGDKVMEGVGAVAPEEWPGFVRLNGGGGSQPQVLVSVSQGGVIFDVHHASAGLAETRAVKTIVLERIINIFFSLDAGYLKTSVGSEKAKTRTARGKEGL